MASRSRQLLKQHPVGQLLLDGTLSDETIQAIESARAGDGFELVDVIETEHRCPKCGYEWNGNPRPGTAADEEVEA